MSFLTRKQITRVELDDASRQALVELDNDVQTLMQLTREVSAKASEIINQLTQDILTTVPSTNERPPEPDGITVFTSKTPNEERVRNTPFTRRPRSEQVAWLRELLADGEWHAPIVIAREYANDERHYRYLRSAVGGRMREMFEDGEVERRSSKVKGSMFEYRSLR